MEHKNLQTSPLKSDEAAISTAVTVNWLPLRAAMMYKALMHAFYLRVLHPVAYLSN
jgi:hypothetical protein